MHDDTQTYLGERLKSTLMISSHIIIGNNDMQRDQCFIQGPPWL